MGLDRPVYNELLHHKVGWGLWPFGLPRFVSGPKWGKRCVPCWAVGVPQGGTYSIQVASGCWAPVVDWQEQGRGDLRMGKFVP